MQSAEQHPALEAHALPSVRHAALRVAHWPPVHVWLQQLPFDVHTRPSDVHAG
jgi:hypothetical protein